MDERITLSRLPVVLALVALVASACTGAGGDISSAAGSGTLTIYSGRGEDLVGPLIDRFRDESGLQVRVRYAGSPELAATILEEGENSPADVFYAQDPASLGAVAQAGLFEELPPEILAAVPVRFRDGGGRWVGTSGRLRVLVYNTEQVSETELPESIWDLTRPEWRGRIGLAPTNGSFLTFVAAMILTDGEERALEWLRAIEANEPVTFDGNSAIVAAVDAGDVAVGLVNHYYLYQLQAQQGEVSAANHLFPEGDPGSLVMTAGAGVLATGGIPAAANEFVEFLLSEEAQKHFAEQTFEYPLVAGVEPPPRLPPLEGIETPHIELSDLAGAIDRATDLVTEAGLI